MTEIRCVKCGRLLLKADLLFDYVAAEIKCPKCGYINKFLGKPIDIIKTINENLAIY